MKSRVEHLLLTSIDSVEQCDMLVTMHASPGRWWTARELAQELHLADVPTGHDLEALASRGFLDVRAGTELHFRIAPNSNEMAEDVADLSAAYQTSRGDVMGFIVLHKGRALRHFAQAFNFRRQH